MTTILSGASANGPGSSINGPIGPARDWKTVFVSGVFDGALVRLEYSPDDVEWFQAMDADVGSTGKSNPIATHEKADFSLDRRADKWRGYIENAGPGTLIDMEAV